jgi:hypothetical protein
LYPDIQKAYDLAQDLRNIFEKTTDKIIAEDWQDGMKSKSIWVKSFNTISRSIMNHINHIKYFDREAPMLLRNHSMLK